MLRFRTCTPPHSRSASIYIARMSASRNGKRWKTVWGVLRITSDVKEEVDALSSPLSLSASALSVITLVSRTPDVPYPFSYTVLYGSFLCRCVCPWPAGVLLVLWTDLVIVVLA